MAVDLQRYGNGGGMLKPDHVILKDSLIAGPCENGRIMITGVEGRTPGVRGNVTCISASPEEARAFANLLIEAALAAEQRADS